ncbi:hypothetical protein MY4038_006583 [Beauveria bassiana]
MAQKAIGVEEGRLLLAANLSAALLFAIPHVTFVLAASLYLSRHEAEDGMINLPEEDPQALDLMIWQFYHQDYCVPPHEPITPPDGEESRDQVTEASKSGDDDCALLVHVKVYALAEKLRVPGLKALALKKFREAADQHWASEVFFVAIQEAYATIPESDKQLRSEIADTFYQHQDLLDIPTTRVSLKEVDGLAADILMHFHDKTKGDPW